MRRRLATTRVTVEPHRYPPDSQGGEFTELNYRTRVTTDRQDTATTIRLVSILTLIFIATGFGVRLFGILPLAWGIGILGLLAAVMLGIAYAKFLQKRPPWSDIGWCLGFLAACVMFGATSFAPTPHDAYLFLFGPAVLGTAVLSHFITKQICFWMSVNERMPFRTLKTWQLYWACLWTMRTPRHCPAVASYRASLVALGVAFGAGYGVLYLVSGTEWHGYAAIAGVIGFLLALPTLWFGLDDLGIVSSTPPALAAKVAWRTFRTFVCYNRHQTKAAGVFRFPDRFLRPNLSRDVAVGCSLALLTMALVGVSTTSPRLLLESYWTKPKVEAKTENGEPALTPSERLFLSQLPREKHAEYLAAKRVEHRESWAEWGAGLWPPVRSFLITTGVILLLCWLLPSLLLITILWFVGGRLLAAYYEALEAPDAYEQPYQPTKKELAADIRGRTPWDNRIERIQNSRDELETEHLYLGTSIEGDYPILLHQDLLHRHAHILGDTGSRKTSIGIAPVLAQLIAREDCSVVIFDLKGDMPLFQAAQEEAERSGIPFKWFTNITGRSSFVFNPLRQSHVPRMTTNQLTQGILQALSLEYGEDYGRGYFSALNELVLATYMKHHRRHVGSFRELHRFVSDVDAYRSIGSVDDWEKTRHVASIVDKLAQVVPLNVAGDPDDKEPPPLIREQIDFPTLLREKQVVYFYLSSAQEQTTVPKVAKLALFSLLTAASRRGKGEKNRVYVFVDEFQRVVAENISIFLEQARSMKLHFILANQTIGQLKRNELDLTDIVESCTAFKQSFRASDEASVKRLIESSGEGLYHSLSWTQLLSDAFDEEDDGYLSLGAARKDAPEGKVQGKVKEEAGPRLEKNTIIETSALPLASFVKFTEGSGYTQFSGYWTTVLSEYHITKALFGIREDADWPDQDERTVLVTAEDEPPPPQAKFIEKKTPIAKPTNIPDGFEDDLKERLAAEAKKQAAPMPQNGTPPTPKKKKRKKKHQAKSPPQDQNGEQNP